MNTAHAFSKPALPRERQRCCRQALLSHHPPQTSQPLPFLFSPHLWKSVISSFSLGFFLFHPSSLPERHLSLWIFLFWPPLQHISLCLSTAEAIIALHPSIKLCLLWSISTLSPLHSPALNFKCLPSVSVSTYLPADEAILDSRVDDYYNRFHNAFQHYVCVLQMKCMGSNEWPQQMFLSSVNHPSGSKEAVNLLQVVTTWLYQQSSLSLCGYLPPLFFEQVPHFNFFFYASFYLVLQLKRVLFYVWNQKRKRVQDRIEVELPRRLCLRLFPTPSIFLTCYVPFEVTRSL